MYAQPAHHCARYLLRVRAVLITPCARCSPPCGCPPPPWTQQVLGAQRCTLWMVDREKGVVWSKVFNHQVYSRESLHREEVPMDSGIVGWVVANKTGSRLDDAYKDERCVACVCLCRCRAPGRGGGVEPYPVHRTHTTRLLLHRTGSIPTWTCGTSSPPSPC